MINKGEIEKNIQDIKILLKKCDNDEQEINSILQNFEDKENIDCLCEELGIE